MRVIFLDRDGVINKYPGNFEYVKSWEEFEFLPEVKPALKKLQDAGYKMCVVSNQAGVSKGIYSQESLDLITHNMLAELGCCDIALSGVYYCIHRPEDSCACRKPKAGLVYQALDKLKNEGQKVELGNSYFIGDSVRDVETGKSVGLKTILVLSGREKQDNKNNWHCLPDFTAKSLSEAVEIILTGDSQ